MLASFLTALGVPEAQIPGELDALARLYRSVLAGRRVLVVLDNAATAPSKTCPQSNATCSSYWGVCPGFG